MQALPRSGDGALHDPPRLHVFLARESPVAVVLARYRAKRFHIITWDRSTDKIVDGSWFSGVIHHDRSGISPDGRHLVYFAIGPASGTFAWTAVCEPPRLSALLFWPHEHTWHGGGYFVDARSLWVNIPSSSRVRNSCNYQPARNVGKIYKILHEDTPAGAPRDPPAYGRVHQMENDGWLASKAGTYTWSFVKAGPGGDCLLELVEGYEGMERVARYALRDHAGKPVPGSDLVDGHVTWADWEKDGSLLVARRGRVHTTHPGDAGPGEVLLDLTTIRPPGPRTCS